MYNIQAIQARTIVIASAVFVVFTPAPCGMVLHARSAPAIAPLEISPRTSVLRTPDEAAKTRVRHAYATLPLRFETASAASGVEFIARGEGYVVGLTGGNATLILGGGRDTQRTSVAMRLAGAVPIAAGTARKVLPGITNDLTGNDPRRWRTGLRSYAEVEYRDVYPGVDVVYYGNQRQLEFDFIVAPGARYRAIELAFDGASRLTIDSDGSLIIATPEGNLVQPAPVIYQEDAGIRRSVAGGYASRGHSRVGFWVGAYDPRLPLIIDPVVTYSSYVGGAREERLAGLAVDAAGNMYIAGLTGAADFPVTGSLGDAHGRNNWDMFVLKLNAGGDGYQYVTYLGGSGYEEPAGLGIDSYGNAFVTGTTESWDFPTVNAIQPMLLGYNDSFVAKLGPNGAIAYSTYLGGRDFEFEPSIAVDSEGRAYVTGTTISADFPTHNALQPSLGGNTTFRSRDGGATWVGASNGLRASWVSAIAIDPVTPSTLYAGTFSYGVFKSTDHGATWTPTGPGFPPIQVYAIVVDASHTVYVASGAGVYRSHDQGASWTEPRVWMPASALAIDDVSGVLYAGVPPDFLLPGVLKSDDGGETWTDAGLATGVNGLAVSQSVVFAATPQGVFKSTGGTSWEPASGGLQEWVNSVAVDPTNADVAYAGTWNGLFHTTSGGAEWLPVFELSNVPILHIAIASANPSTVYVATGSYAVMTDDGGATWRGTGPRDTFFVHFAVDPVDPTIAYGATAVGHDVFVSRLSAEGSLEFSTYLGGSNSDAHADIALDASGNAYIAGETFSKDFPVLNAFQSTPGDLFDVFVAKISNQDTLAYATYLAGWHSDYSPRIAVDAAGRAHVTGLTLSTNFPTTPDAYQPRHAGGFSDVFVTTLNEAGTGLVYSTFVGGRDQEVDWTQYYGPALAVWPSGETVVTGATRSRDFPMREAVQSTHMGGGTDAFVLKFDANGALEFSTYLGGRADDLGRRVAIDSAGAVIVAGATTSTDFPTRLPVQAANAGAQDVFITRIEGVGPRDTVPPTTTAHASGAEGANGWYTSSVTVTLSAHDDAGGSGVAVVEYSVNGNGFQRYTGPFSVAAEGTTTIRARAIDAAGNVEEPGASLSLMIDSTSPAILITSPASAEYLHSDALAISFDLTDAVSGLDDGTPAATMDGVAVANGQVIQPMMLALGPHSLSVTASDRAGNTVTRTVEFRMIATIESLIAAVDLFVAQGLVDAEVASSLLAKLGEARDARDRGAQAAVGGSLRAFSNQVAGLNGQSISPHAAAVLLEDAAHVSGAM